MESLMPPKIESYGMGKIVVDGHSYTSDLIILPDRIFQSWWRKTSHSVTLDDLAEALKEAPEVLIIGKGRFGRMEVPADTRSALEARNVEVIARSTQEACQIYNEMRDSRKVAAALHLTC
jgi:hypothetical protein